MAFSEQVQLAGIVGYDAGGVLSAQESMGGDEHAEFSGVVADPCGKARTG